MNPALHQARIRIVVLALLCLAAAAALMHRFYVVQIVRHEELLGKARERVTTTEDRMKQRGRIFDAQGYLLVGCNSGDLVSIPGLGRSPGVFWPREFHGLYSPWGHKEMDTIE